MLFRYCMSYNYLLYKIQYIENSWLHSWRILTNYVLRTRRLRWYGHVQRATSCINSIMRLGLPGTRDRGRPRKTWSACVRNDMTICNLDGVNLLDRNSWRTSVRCCLPRSPGQPQHLKYQNRIWWICYCAIFDTGEHSTAADTRTNDCCIQWRCAINMPWSAAGLLSSVEAEEAFKMKLSLEKTTVLWKILYCRIVESVCSW